MATEVFKLQNGNVLVVNEAGEMSFPPDMQVKKFSTTQVEIKDKSGSRQHVFTSSDVNELTRRDGTIVSILGNTQLLFTELVNFFFFKLGSGGANHFGTFINYTDLVTQYPTASVGDLANVLNSQGFPFLPGPILGTFYSKGGYIWNGTNWSSNVDEIAAQIEQNINDIISLQTTVLNHVTDLNNPHQTTFANLDDTNITSPTNGDVATYIGGEWVNQPPSVTIPTFNFVSWNVTTQTLPVTSTVVDFLNVDFFNFNGDVILTGQLPTNLKTGARVILRKKDSTNGKIIFDDGVVLYKFVNKPGEYISLVWNGSSYIIN